MKRLTLFFCFLFPLCCFGAGEKEYKLVTVSQADRDRAVELVSKMTLKQKCTLISGLKGDAQEPNKNTLGGCPELGIAPVYMADGPQGINSKSERDQACTYYACGVSAAASFDREAVLGMGDGLGLDARARGVGFLLGPGANIYRAALCGRNFEYFGEDPYLAGEMAVCYVKGVQSHGVIATIKHFAVNNQEWDRFITSTNVDERTLNEIYFPAFRKAVQEAHIGAVMAACGRLNATHCSENPYLFRQTLRDDWGFEGVTMCDWQTIYSTLNGIRGGLDIEMPNPFTRDYARIKYLVDNGVLRQEELDEKCIHIIQTLSAFGLLDRPHRDETMPLDNPYCHEKAYQAAVGGPVMVKNNGILPLKKGLKNGILLTGEFADKPCGGGGSGWVLPFENRYITTAKADFGKGYKVTFAPEPTDEQIRNSSAVIVEVGFGKRVEGENNDHVFGLPEDQEEQLERVASLTDRMIVIIHSGAEVDMRPWSDKAAAIIYAWYGGEHTGTVLSQILTGKVSPSGRLPFTMWGSFENNPASETYYADKFIKYMNRPRFEQCPHVDYKEGVFIGYRAIEKFKREPLYPFGYGLTYSTFKYSDLEVVKSENGFTLTFNLKNEGKMAASEVPQVYVAPLAPSLPRPVRELKQFTKVRLAPGESRQISINLPLSAFEHYDVPSHGWKADSGKYIIQIAENAQSVLLHKEIIL